ncbi:unnamed protein product [Cylicocyclus nassatus]|uniref:Uncharacterized protein n=1 Tax=Cylicocyclus nassatus TaxID=53992 RepID=A0AA36HCB3_CYLNA|nr:unnamed protein product [Cylicocyclus nassatus]
MGQAQSSQIDEQSAAELRLRSDDITESEAALKNLDFAQKRALELVRHQDLFTFEFAAATSMACILLAAGSITKRKDFAIPIAPLVMWAGYRYENAFGENHEVVKDKAEALLKKGDPRLNLVGGPITLKEIDAYRERHFR